MVLHLDAGADAPHALDLGSDTGCPSPPLPDAGSPLPCPSGCSGHGVCDTVYGVCACDLGYFGDPCDTCAPGFTAAADGSCAFGSSESFDLWPNRVSSVNSDPWLVVNHDALRELHPVVLVLNFVNPSDPPAVDALLAQIVAAFREGSRAQGFVDATTPPQLLYEIAGVRDLRDGVDGRPPAPAGYPWQNSTLYPRRAPGEPGTWGFRYADLFSTAFAPYLGYTDSDGTFLDLCTIVEAGEINELWIVGSGDVPGDASAAEVLEWMPHYTATGNRRYDDDGDACAGNGCFDADVPHCNASLRIGFVNYTRGPGCYLHSQGHAIESAASHGDIPAWRDWFLPFSRFDLHTRYALPFDSLYDVRCASPPCIAYPMPDHARFTVASTFDVPAWDGACGNVHFPPNALSDYDYEGVTRVASSCDQFGLSPITCDATPPPTTVVTHDAWHRYDALAPDCGGDFLVWWYQHMPGFGSAQHFSNGAPMKSNWPFLFY